MKAVVALLVVAVLGALGFFLLRGGDGPPVPSGGSVSDTAQTGPGAERSSSVERGESSTGREEVPVPAPKAETPEHPKPSGRSTTLSGRVVHADDGISIPGATVACARLTSVADLAAARSTRTDADGRFRFEDIEIDGSVQVASLGLSITVDPKADGWPEVTLRIPREPSLIGDVVDANGHGVADATISISVQLDPTSMLPVARSKEDGHFELFGTAERVWIRAGAKGFRASDAYLVDRQGAAPKLRISLDGDPLRVTGRVLAPGGGGVRGATVLAKTTGDATSGTSHEGFVRRTGEGITARSDDDGRFVIDGLPPGAIRISSRADGVGYGEAMLADTPSRSAEVSVQLQGFASLEGSVHAIDGSVPAALTIGIRTWPRELGTQWAQVRRDGSFAVEDVCPGRFQAQVWREGSPVIAADIELRPGERGRWPVTLPDPAGIAGVVIDPRAQPLSEYDVVAWRDGKWLASTRSDAQGRFDLPNLTEGPVTLRVGKRPAGNEGRSFAQNAASLDTTAPDRRVQIVVPDETLSTAKVLGRVLTPEGANLPGALVQLSATGGGAIRLTSGDDGRFEASEVTPGEYHVQIKHADHAPLFIGMRTIHVAETVDFGELRMPPSGHLRVRVTSTDGVSTSGVQMIVLDNVGRQVDTLRPDGEEFRSGPLPVGPMTLGISGDAIARTTVDVTIQVGAEARLEVQVRRGLRTSFVANLPPGNAVPNWVWLSIFDAQSTHLGGVALERGEDGAWRVDTYLAPGHYTVAFGTDGNRFRAQIEFDAAEGAVVPANLTADSGR
ncbi:MAG: carboxypeptidase-like regulatory domain-containing protein [Planctomycetota bacterium]